MPVIWLARSGHFECLIDYFPDDWLLVVDESHVTCSQLQAMYNGDRSRKQVLIDHGFGFPSAADNRPLKGTEFWDKPNKPSLSAPHLVTGRWRSAMGRWQSR